MRVTPLASGSRGNATLVEFDRAGLFGPVRLLVDAGLSAREITRRLELLDVPPRSIDAVLLSHEHDDHARGAERFSMRHGVPVLCSIRTLEALDRCPTHFAAWYPLAADHRSEIGGVVIEPFAVPHDAVDPLGFVLSTSGKRFGIATDLGHAPASVADRLRGCQILMVESNHDDRMLQEGPYPPRLKRRVGGLRGHLSNREAASLLGAAVDRECRAVVLAHLSDTNNTRELARRSAARAVGAGPEIRIAAADVPGPPVTI